MDAIDFEDWYRERVPAGVCVRPRRVRGPRLAAEATDEAFVRALERWSRVAGDGLAGRLDLRRRAQPAAPVGAPGQRGSEPLAVPRDTIAPEIDVGLWDAVRGAARNASVNSSRCATSAD